MQKYVFDNGAVGIEDLDRWFSNSDAVGFLSATTSASSADELMNVSVYLFLKSVSNPDSTHFSNVPCARGA
jgi:hypothetical protein